MMDERMRILLEYEGKRFRLFRKELGKTQEQMAKELQVPQSRISVIERGKGQITESQLKYLYDEYGLDGRWLRKGYGTMFETEYRLKCNTASTITESIGV